MKAIILCLTVVLASVSGEQLPLRQPKGYRIRVPAVPFTAEDVLSQPRPSRQHRIPVRSSAASAPANRYQEPAPAPTQYQQRASAPTYQEPAQYDFLFAVDSSDVSGNKVDFGHSEQRDGAHTSGSYHVLLPDTRVMRVEYYVDETGFHPVTSYEGEAVYASASTQQRTPSQLYAQPGRQ